ncbi:hemolysin III [Marmoricola sp. OAE513]|uniref:PAQR family membrane homeostasis protein TrhA n=1 Tax=Marmoricola sp. OAE513 TaxID=2817894 RepID=UPI001AE30BB7
MNAKVPVSEKAEEVVDKAADVAADSALQLHRAMMAAKPKLRGWLHAATSPLTIAAGVVLICLSPTAATKVSSALFAGTAILLFTVSGIYHRGNWSPKVWAFWKRFDHANIFFLIAGSYTPFAITLLDGGARVGMLVIVWTGAVLGVGFKLFWTNAPRWLSAPIYIALGWAAIFYADDFAGGGSAVITLVVVGGGLYTLGGLVYALKRPDPFPTWFGFHEIFHLFTIAAFVCHYIAASIATYKLR